jgi:hypothetical protein
MNVKSINNISKWQMGFNSAFKGLTKDLCHTRLKDAMFFFPTTLAVSRRPLIAEAKVRSQASPREIYGGKIGNETDFSPSTSVFLCRYHSTNAPYSFCTICCSDQMSQWAKPGNIPITHNFGNRRALYRKALSLLSLKYHLHYSSSELQR